MSKRIVFKKLDGGTVDLADYEIEGLAELRRLLPPAYAEVSDGDLLGAWGRYSEDYYCAGFLGVDEFNAKEFAAVTKVVDGD